MEVIIVLVYETIHSRLCLSSYIPRNWQIDLAEMWSILNDSLTVR
jgi:hypothetical protein